FSFTGSNSYVDVGNGASLQLTNNISIDAWVNPTGVSPGTGTGRILSKGVGGRSGYGFGRISDGRIIFTTYGIKDYITVGSYLPLNTWTHVAVVFTSAGGTGTASFYINGAFVESVTATGGAGAPARIAPQDAVLGAQHV